MYKISAHVSGERNLKQKKIATHAASMMEKHRVWCAFKNGMATSVSTCISNNIKFRKFPQFMV